MQISVLIAVFTWPSGSRDVDQEHGILALPLTHFSLSTLITPLFRRAIEQVQG